MKRPFLGFGVVVLVSLALVWALHAQERNTRDTSPGQPTAEAPGAEDQIAFTFADEAQMQVFAQLWQQRQVMMTRMAVLQSYFQQEQSGLSQLNQQLLAQYNLDVMKNYRLDPDRKVLLELPTPPAEQTAQASPASAPIQPSSSQQ